MRKKSIVLILFLLFLLPLVACGKEQSKQEIDLLGKPWSEIEKLATGTTVNMFMWGGDEAVNQYIDSVVATKLKEAYNITLVRTPMDAPEFIQKLHTEKQADIKGTIDIIWINGENFANAKDNNLLYGSFSGNLPNVQSYVDLSQYAYDFGTSVDELEAPWGKVQFVFYYDSAKVTNPPKSFTELKQWVAKNPGKFTYPNAEEFTGNAFVRHLLYEFNEEDQLFGDSINFAATTESVWTYLNEIKPHLWREGKTYPETLTALDQLYANGEVYFTMGYNEARAQSLIENGTFPKTTKSFLLDVGSIGNSHYLAIPFNAPNVSGAMVAINEFLSPEAQLKKLDASMWGENTSLDITKLDEEMKQKFDKVDRGASTLPARELQGKYLAEVPTSFVEYINEHWMVNVVPKK